MESKVAFAFLIVLGNILFCESVNDKPVKFVILIDGGGMITLEGFQCEGKGTAEISIVKAGTEDKTLAEWRLYLKGNCIGQSIFNGNLKRWLQEVEEGANYGYFKIKYTEFFFLSQSDPILH